LFGKNFPNNYKTWPKGNFIGRLNRIIETGGTTTVEGDDTLKKSHIYLNQFCGRIEDTKCVILKNIYSN
jgi:hypothetical protein